jgi:hypothetical protein
LAVLLLAHGGLALARRGLLLTLAGRAVSLIIVESYRYFRATGGGRAGRPGRFGSHLARAAGAAAAATLRVSALESIGGRAIFSRNDLIWRNDHGC